MYILGMTGPIGHGKSTFAKTVEKLEPKSIHYESSIIISDVANAWQASLAAIPKPDDIDGINTWLKTLPGILRKVVHLSCTYGQIKLVAEELNHFPSEYEKLLLYIAKINHHPSLVKQTITPRNKDTYRPLLQWLGGYLVDKTDPLIWHGEIIRRMQEKQDGYKVCIIGGIRYPIEAELIHESGGIIIEIYRPGLLQPDAEDPTERQRNAIVPNVTIINNGTLTDLNACAERLLKDLDAEHVQKVYQTATGGARP